MLELAGIAAGYGRVRVLHGISLTVAAGEVHVLMGRNGAGKTTALKAVMGLLPLAAGEVRLGGAMVSGLPPHRVPALGLGYVPQGRRLFAGLTVGENLAVALRLAPDPAAARARVLDLFPRLGERLHQRAETLSGGEQQMLAMGRALCLAPKVLLLDEPTEGLQPSMVGLIREVTRALRAEGVGILLVEQRAEAVLALADRVSFLETGRIVATATGEALRADPAPMRDHAGIG